MLILTSHKNTNSVEDVEYLPSLSFVEFYFVVEEKKSKNVSANERMGGHPGFPINPKTLTWSRILRS